MMDINKIFVMDVDKIIEANEYELRTSLTTALHCIEWSRHFPNDKFNIENENILLSKYSK